MSNSILRIFQFQGYKTVDVKPFLTKKRVEIHLEPIEIPRCYDCLTELDEIINSYPLDPRHLDIFGLVCVVKFRRRRGPCPKCKKTKAEHVEFLSPDSPHVTKEFAWFVEKVCEIATVKESANFAGIDKMLAYRLDYRFLRRMLAGYKIPVVRKISVDEVYGKKKKKKGETRDDLFLTIITDLRTKKVIFVSLSRRKEALDRFFILIGPEACKKIRIVACDQHEAYKLSVEQYCKKAVVVWDRFHLVQSLNKLVNDVRRELHANKALPEEERKLLQGKYKYIFLKRSKNRTKNEEEHVEKLMDLNRDFFLLEMIKEMFGSFFDSTTEDDALEVWDEIGRLVLNLMNKSLVDWYYRLDREQDQLLLYFKYRVTTSLSEGINNVVKALKRKAFGYRDMEYFGMKIMQKCGYLNSRYISNPYKFSLQF